MHLIATVALYKTAGQLFVIILLNAIFHSLTSQSEEAFRPTGPTLYVFKNLFLQSAVTSSLPSKKLKPLSQRKQQQFEMRYFVWDKRKNKRFLTGLWFKAHVTLRLPFKSVSNDL